MDNKNNGLGKNQTIARNSIFMSLRMVIVLAISLYTTRVVLNTLGIIDYGIYNVVCGFVSMFAFFNVSMSNGIQRYINYELSKNGIQRAKLVYNASIRIQVSLAFFLIVISEIIGNWYINNKMVIPDERFHAALWIFQISIFSFVLVILRVPYTAVVMAHEKLDFYSIISVAEAILKLCIALILPFIQIDNLISYCSLLFLVDLFNLVVYIVYTKSNYDEVQIMNITDMRLLKSMLGFSGWNLFGTFSHIMKEQGLNLILNLFCGPAVNAARGIAAQVNAGLQNFVQNITVPVRPQITSSYAVGNMSRVMNLTYTVSKFSCYFLYALSLPILLEIDFILNIWLDKSVPMHTASFVLIIILTSFLNNLNAPISNVVHASGRMKNYQLYNSLCVLLSVPLSYYVLYLGGTPEAALSVVLFSMVLCQVVSLIILKTIVNFSYREYLISVLVPLIRVVLLSIWIPTLFRFLLPNGLIRVFLVFFSSISFMGITIWFGGITTDEKIILLSFYDKIKLKWKKQS
ncbi:MAG: hypothetical protein J5965_28490 [Aeriscardovia sp.]|nr:hypothetical protein [Aeriscardovia sp.]